MDVSEARTDNLDLISWTENRKDSNEVDTQ